MTPFLGLIHLPEQLTELKETFIFTSLLKDKDQQLDEERYSGRCGKVLSAGASVLADLSCVTLLVYDVFTNLETLQTPYS